MSLAVIFPGLSAVIFLGGSASGVYSSVHHWNQLRVWAGFLSAEGRRLEVVYRPDGERLPCPVAEFQASGRTHRIESSFGTSPASQEMGQLVDNKYDPPDTHQARIDSALTNNPGFGIMMFLAITGSCAGASFLLRPPVLHAIGPGK